MLRLSAEDVKLTIAVIVRCFSNGIVHGVLLATWCYAHDRLKLVVFGELIMLGPTVVFVGLLPPLQDTILSVLGLCLGAVTADLRERTTGEKLINHIIFALLATGTVGVALGVLEQFAPATSYVGLKFAACTIGMVVLSMAAELLRLRNVRYRFIAGYSFWHLCGFLCRKSYKDFSQLRVWLSVRIPWLVALAVYPPTEREWMMFWLTEGPGPRFIGLGVVTGFLWFSMIVATCKIYGEVVLLWWLPQNAPITPLTFGYAERGRKQEAA